MEKAIPQGHFASWAEAQDYKAFESKALMSELKAPASGAKHIFPQPVKLRRISCAF